MTHGGQAAAGGHLDKHLEEAREVAVFEGASSAQIEIQLGHVCNNRCVFCVSGQLTEQGLARSIPEDPVFATLEAARARGARKLTFLGGEPTLQKSFLPALRKAVDLGFEEIVIFTNGVKTRRPEYIDQIVRLGRFTWRFSIQGGNAEAHDRVTGRVGAFQRIVDGMAHLKALGQDITANMCINELSYRSLPDYPALAAEYGLRQLHIDMIRPADAGARTDAYLRDIMPRYADMAPFIAQMLEGFARLAPEVDVNIGNYPYCLVPEWAHKVHHDGEATMTVAVDGDQLSEPWDKYTSKRSDKRHPAACDGCVFKPQCNGLFDKYRAFYGDDEVRPVTRARLAQVDRAQRFFVLQVEPLLEAALAEAAPAPWRLAELFRNTRDRRVELRFSGGSAGLTTLALTPPDAAGAPEPVVAFERLGLSALPDPGADAEQVVALLGWLASRLAAAGAGAPIMRVPAPELVARWTTPERLERARARILRLTSKLERARVPLWSYEGARPLDDGLGTGVTFAGPRADRVEVRLSVQSDPARPPVAIGYRLGDGTDEAGARQALGALMAALRG